MNTKPIHRTLTQDLIQLIENKKEFNNVILVEGPRQVGKTTLIQQTLDHLDIPFKEANLEENPRLAQQMDQCQDFSEFTQLVEVALLFSPGGKEILFIDEAQQSEKLGSFVRFMKEKWAHTQVILSGSSMARIFRKTRFPVGRVTPLVVTPFLFEEFILAGNHQALYKILRTFPDHRQISSQIHKILLDLLEVYLEVGGLPEVVTTYFANKGGDAWKQLRENLLFGYYNDFKRVYGEEKEAYFKSSLKTVAHLLGMPFKNSHVAALLDGGKNYEIIKTLSQLESWHMVYHVEQRGKEVSQHFHPKRYLFDIGIARELREAALPKIALIHTIDTPQRSALGGVIENVVAQALSIQLKELTGWKKAVSGSEVDFVIKHKSKTIPVECKSALKIKNNHLGGILDFLQMYNVDQGIVVSLAPFELRKFADGKKIICLPLYLMNQIWQLL